MPAKLGRQKQDGGQNEDGSSGVLSDQGNFKKGYVEGWVSFGNFVGAVGCSFVRAAACRVSGFMF